MNRRAFFAAASAAVASIVAAVWPSATPAMSKPSKKAGYLTRPRYGGPPVPVSTPTCRFGDARNPIPVAECPYLPEDVVLLVDDVKLRSLTAAILGEEPDLLPEGNRRRAARRILRSPGLMIVLRNIGTEKEKP